MPEHVTIIKGTCFALFAYDVGLSINLTDAERRIIAGTERGRPTVSPNGGWPLNVPCPHPAGD